MGKIRSKAKTVPNKPLKATLIEVSENIIETEGLDALTLRRAARVSGVSHMAPYRHFEDKDALLAAVAGQGFLELAKSMQQATLDEPDPLERLLNVGVAYVFFAYHSPGKFRLMFSQGIGNRERFTELTQAGEIAFSVCANAVADCYVGEKALPAEKLNLRALAVWSLVHGLAGLLIDNLVDLPVENPDELKVMVIAILRESRTE